MRSVFDVTQLMFLRFLMRLMLKRNMYKEPIKVIEKFRERFISKGYLNDDLSKGPETPKYSIIDSLVSAFESLRYYRNEDDFYLQVAKQWVGDLYSSNHKISSFFVIVYGLILLTVFINQSFITIPGEMMFIGLFVLPLLGFISAIGGRGWKRLMLMSINILVFAYSIIIVA
ncbi:hypothetical protein [Halobacillus litoralis]|uniref:hypothetical protein n=1 Tax=Halobacillus litoralis TaxID=45668 RepID=UPI001368E4FB|nr:hypothetical protein [Halobacillus litoralis]MYL39800.1 hypothetical protein [Halobacillus litoralis]